MRRECSQECYSFIGFEPVIEVLVITGLLTVIMAMISSGTKLETIIPILAFYTVTEYRIMPAIQRMLGNANNIQNGLRFLRQDILIKPETNREGMSPASAILFGRTETKGHHLWE